MRQCRPTSWREGVSRWASPGVRSGQVLPGSRGTSVGPGRPTAGRGGGAHPGPGGPAFPSSGVGTRHVTPWVCETRKALPPRQEADVGLALGAVGEGPAPASGGKALSGTRVKCSPVSPPTPPTQTPYTARPPTSQRSHSDLLGPWPPQSTGRASASLESPPLAALGTDLDLGPPRLGGWPIHELAFWVMPGQAPSLLPPKAPCTLTGAGTPGCSGLQGWQQELARLSLHPRPLHWRPDPPSPHARLTSDQRRGRELAPRSIGKLKDKVTTALYTRRPQGSAHSRGEEGPARLI